LLTLANQIWEVERKLTRLDHPELLYRNITKMKEALGDLGLEYEDPTGQTYDETRTDCSASIAGVNTADLVVTETLKPIVRIRSGNRVCLIQQAVVIVSSTHSDTEEAHG
jgi:hypothetical protein